MADSRDAAVRRIVVEIMGKAKGADAGERGKAAWEALYAYRNAEQGIVNDLIDNQGWKAKLDAEDPEVVAAAEHYCYAFHKVATGEVEFSNMKRWINAYQAMKELGLDMRAGNKPTTPPSEFQRNWEMNGATEGQTEFNSQNWARVTRLEMPKIPNLNPIPTKFIKTKTGYGY